MIEPGKETTEYKLAKGLAIAGSVIPMWSFLAVKLWPGSETEAIIAALASTFLAAASILGYQYSRHSLKASLIESQVDIAKTAIVNNVVPPAENPVANAVTQAVTDVAVDKLEDLIRKKL